MVDPRSRRLPALTIDRVDVLGTELDYVIVRVAGSWERPPIDPPRPVLLVMDNLEQVRFDPLRETSLAAVRVARGSAPFRATFSVPVELTSALEGDLALDVGGRRVGMPRIGAAEPGEPTSSTVVGRSELAERRARRAEAAEETNALRAAEAEQAVAGLEADLARLELRLERAEHDRDDLAAAIGERERQMRRAEQRAEAEQHRREEAVEEAIEDVRRADTGRAQLEHALAAAEAEADELRGEAEALRRRLAGGATDPGAGSVAEADDVDVLVPAPAVAPEPARLRTEAGHAYRLTSRPLAPAPHAPGAGGPHDLELLRAERALRRRMAGGSPGWEGFRQELLRRDAVVDELHRELERERAAAAVDAAELERAVADLRAEVQTTLAAVERAHAEADTGTEELVRDVTAAAGRALAGAETRIGEAHRAVAGLEGELAREREQAAATARGAEAARAELAAERARGEELAAEAERQRAVAAELAAFAARAQEGAEAASHGARAAGRLERELSARGDDAALLARIVQLEETVATLTAQEAPAPAVAPEPEPGTLWLPRALDALIAEDPEAAARLLVQLVPAQGAGGAGPDVDYDLRLAPLGCFAVALGPGRPRVRPLDAPRRRTHVDFRLETDPAGLLALLEHGGVRRLLRGRHVRVRATWRRRRSLAALPPVPLGLGDLARSSVWPSPGLVYRALAGLIEPEWTAGHAFTVAQEIIGPSGGTWYVRVADRAPVTVTDAAPAAGADATVRMSQRSFHDLLDGRLPGLDDRVAIRGDARVAGLLGVWTERAQRT